MIGDRPRRQRESASADVREGRESTHRRFAVFPIADEVYVEVSVGSGESAADRAREQALDATPRFADLERLAVVPAEWLLIFSRAWVSNQHFALSPVVRELEDLRASIATTRHEFYGRHGRPCGLCGLADRHEIHAVQRGRAHADEETLS